MIILLALRVEGKVVTVFLLRMLCIIVSCISIAGEMLSDGLSIHIHFSFLSKLKVGR